MELSQERKRSSLKKEHQSRFFKERKSMRAYERLIRYAKVYTTSDPESSETPSTLRQFDLAKLLKKEMEETGIEDVSISDKCYVTGFIPATRGYENVPRLGFIAHMDTAPDFSGANVNPQLHEHYDGQAISLGCGRVIDPKSFPDLIDMKGKTVMTADGSTLLGADDKAGVAEIMTMAESLISGNIPHGKICIAFTPDEEIGSGAKDLDLDAFGADFAYTVDGGYMGEITYETFNAAQADFDITGFAVHPGSGKDVMVNAALVACEINSMLPPADIPRLTEGYEGFFHLIHMSGDVEKASIAYIVRDHKEANFYARLDILRHIEKTLNNKYGENTVHLIIKQQYRNMEEKIRPCMHLVETAKTVMKSLGVEPDTAPVRGGTDGAELSFRGLPCPNLGTGGYGYHGPYEHIAIEDMDTVADILLGIVKSYSKKYS